MTHSDETKGRSRRFFISYSREDKAFAQWIRASLLDHGLDLAENGLNEYELNSGDSIAERIEDAIEASDYLLILLSPHSVKSRWVERELNLALYHELITRGITIIPVIIADCAIPSALARHAYIDLRDDTGIGLSQLAERLRHASVVDFSTLDSRTFERLVTDLLKSLGFKLVEEQASSLDRGYDLKAQFPQQNPFGSRSDETWLIELKFYGNQRPSLKSVSQLASYVASLPEGVKGVVITNGKFTSVARDWLASEEDKKRRRIDLIDGTALTRLIINHPEIVKRYFGTDFQK
jgi:hypothetical protein